MNRTEEMALRQAQGKLTIQHSFGAAQDKLTFKKEVDPSFRWDDRGTCENCEHSVPAGDPSWPTLICRHKAGAELPWQVVESNGACSNYERSRELVTLDIAAALAEGAKLIPLSQDKFAIVDAEDYEWLSKYKWCASRKKHVFYARRNERRTRRQIIMHRFILNAPKGLFVDHINHNGLDNRRKNLRLCTRAENNRNRRPNLQANQSSKYKGVSFDKKRDLFRAFIYRNKKQYYLGSFQNETDAAKAYDKKARELFGQFAYLNFPQERSEVQKSKGERTPNIQHSTPNVEFGIPTCRDGVLSNLFCLLTNRPIYWPVEKVAKLSF